MDTLITLLMIDLPKITWIGTLVQGLFNAIGNYGWTIIVFTLILKAIVLPIEFVQRYFTQKNQVIMKEIQPMVEKIDKAYGDNKRGAQNEKRKLFKKHGYSVFAGCIPMILTMTIFIIMFTGLNSYTAYANAEYYIKIETKYRETIVEEFNELGYSYANYKEIVDHYSTNAIGEQEAKDYEIVLNNTQIAVGKYAEDERQGFIWIKNIWRPDTWAKVMPDADEFAKGSIGMPGVSGVDKEEYTVIHEGVLANAGGYGKAGWNGLLILPLLSLLTQFLSMKITMRAQSGGDKKIATSDPTMQSAKYMQFLMPIMMTVFVLFYTAAFGLYIVSNAVLSILANLGMTPLVKKIVKKQKEKKTDNTVSYRR